MPSSKRVVDSRLKHGDIKHGDRYCAFSRKSTVPVPMLYVPMLYCGRLGRESNRDNT